MTADRFAFVTAGLYWCLIICWLVIVLFYWREHRRLKVLSPLVGTMLVVVFLDGARTLLESVYFGTWYTARTGLIPRYLWDVLSEPQNVFVPKLINLFAALTIIGVLLRQWFPDLRAEVARQNRTEHLYTELQEAHEELKAAEIARDHLAHMLVHDMRTPLTNVITGLQTVQQLEQNSELTDELVGGALTGANRVLTMVNDLLDISKMEAGEITPERRRFGASEVMADAIGLVDALAREKRLRITQDVIGGRPGGDLYLIADREQMRRVLVNLLGNAVKFTPDGGSVSVRAEPADAGMARISVADTGPGIPPEHQAHIFDKFYQVEQGAANGIQATGLGLTFCKLAVEAHGGRVGVESKPGAGCRFWFTIPASS